MQVKLAAADVGERHGTELLRGREKIGRGMRVSGCEGVGKEEEMKREREQEKEEEEMRER